MTPRKKKILWVVTGLVFLLLALPTIVIEAVWGDLLEGASELPSRISEAKSAGLILDPVAYGREVVVDPSENAYRDLAPVFKTIYRDKDFSSQDTSTAMAAWGRHPGLLDQALSALRKPHYDAGRDYRKGIYALYPDFSESKALARALAHQLRDAGAKDDLQRADRSLDGCCRLADLVNQEQDLIGCLVASTVRFLATTACWDAVSLHPGDPKWARLPDRLHSGQLIVDWPKVVRRDLLMNYVSLKDVDPWGRDYIAMLHAEMDPDRSRLPPIGPGSRDAALARVLAHYTKLYKQLRPGISEAELTRVFKQSVTEADRDHRPSSKMLGFVAWDYSVDIERLRDRAEVEESLLIGARLLESRIEHGQFPATLPIAAKSNLVYKRVGTGFRLYSKGGNGRDDSGPDKPGLHKALNSDDYGIFYSSGP